MKLQKTILTSAIVLSLLMIMPVLSAKADNDKDKKDDNKELVSAPGSNISVKIGNGGSVSVEGAKVTSISGSDINLSTSWSNSSLSYTVHTNSSTKFYRRFGAVSSISEISLGDYVSFSGSISGISGNTISVTASKVVDASIQAKNSTIEGYVKSVAATSFVVNSRTQGDITANISSTTVFLKNGVNVGMSSVVVGSNVTVSGVLNNLGRTLATEKVVIKNNSVMTKTTFEGKLKSIASTSIPTSLVMTIGNKDYTVNIASDTAVLNKLYLRTSLSNFKVGDTIRVYGAVRSDNELMIDATVLRGPGILALGFLSFFHR